MVTPNPPANVGEARSCLAQDRWTPSHLNIAQLLKHRADVAPEKAWLTYVDEDREVRRVWTYAETADAVARTASLLTSRGITQGDRVACLLGNLDHTIILYLATWSIGASVAPINAGESQERKEFILSNSEARLLFCRSDYLADGETLAGTLNVDLIVVTNDDEAVEGVSDRYPAMIDGLASLNLATVDFDGDGAEALLIYTSGTTGPPKGVQVDQFNMMVDAKSMAEWHGWDENLRMMCVLPIHHVNGIIVTHITPLFCGGTTLLNSRFKSGSFWERIAEERVQVVSVVPTLLEFLMEEAEKHDGNPPGLEKARETMQTILCGAGPLLVETAMSFERTFGVPLTHGYGLSETTCYNCHLPADLSDDERHAWLSQSGFPSIGVPLPHQEMTILDANGEAAEEEQRGEICIRGDAVSLGYFNRPEANEKAFSDGWFHSGDEGFWKKDSKGRRFFFITGRIKELIIRGGVNYAPLEIDEVLNGLPGVRYGLAVPFPNKYYGDEIAAYIVPAAGQDVDVTALLEQCVQALGFSKSPKLIVLGDEVPYTTTGKPRRIALAASLVEPLTQYRGHQFRKSDLTNPIQLDLRDPAR